MKRAGVEKMKKNLLAAMSLGAFLLMAPAAPADELAIPVKGGEEAGLGAGEDVFIYTIVPRDTLWDISGKFLENPFKWPKLWRYNSYIKNPDLIYPGNIVRITPDGIEVLTPSGIDPDTLPVLSLTPREEKVVVLQPPPEPVVVPPPPAYASDSIRKAGFISDEELASAGAIIGPKDKKDMMNEGDTVFISFGDGEDVVPGDRFTIFKEGETIKHPVSGKTLGHVVEVVGTLTAGQVDGDVVTANIDSSFKEIDAGSRLKRFAEPVTEVVITEADGPVDGYVVAALEHTEQLADSNVIYIDRGTSDGVATGNVMRVFRPTGTTKDPMRKGKKLTLPMLELGTIIVIEAGENTSTALIVDSLRPIVWGDMVSTVGVERLLGQK